MLAFATDVSRYEWWWEL